jgi:hypothetical protein
MIFYVTNLPFRNDWSDAIAIGPIIFIKESKKNNIGILEHEKFHVKMFFAFLFAFLLIALILFLINAPTTMIYASAFLSFSARSLLYAFFSGYRLWEEVKAYAIQHTTNKESEQKLVQYSKTIAAHYNVKADSSYILEKLKNEIAKSN